MGGDTKLHCNGIWILRGVLWPCLLCSSQTTETGLPGGKRDREKENLFTGDYFNLANPII